MLPCANLSVEKTSATKSVRESTFAPTDGIYELQDNIESASTTETADQPMSTSVNYSSLQTSDIGKVAEYTNLTRQNRHVLSKSGAGKEPESSDPQYSNVYSN